MAGNSRTPQTNTSNNTMQQLHDVPVQLLELMHQIADESIEQHLSLSLQYRIECMSIQETAETLHINHDTIRQWIKSGKLRASKVGKEWLIRKQDVDHMLTINANVLQMDKRFSSKRKIIPPRYKTAN